MFGELLGGRVERQERLDCRRAKISPDEASRWSAAEGSLNRLDCLRPLAARSDDADLPPEGFQQYLPIRAAARPLALEYLWPVLNESGCGDNRQDSFSRSFADALLRTRSHDPGSHAGWIRSASPRRPAAMGWPERRGPPSCSCLGFVGETHTHRSCLDLAAGNVVRYLRERPQPSVVRSTRRGMLRH